ncbi:hypothetical protein AB0F13_27595 [Streptomyces sp. NPDC026206]|uniref:hypothetical protein n=1 Tax=Streptomyces sp. NPDC026206 TaxID=3157089 RepID=UPI00340E2AAF
MLHAARERGEELSRASAPASGPVVGGESRNTATPSAQRYRLTVPRTLLGGQYTLAEDMSQEMENDLGGLTNGGNERNAKGVGGHYTAASDPGPETVIFTGIYGEIGDPKRAMDGWFKGMNGNQGFQVTTPAKDVTPPGVAEHVTCERYAFNRSEGSGTMAVCGWSDHSTVATVSVPDAAAPITLEALAKKTVEMRDELRKPLE